MFQVPGRNQRHHRCELEIGAFNAVALQQLNKLQYRQRSMPRPTLWIPSARRYTVRSDILASIVLPPFHGGRESSPQTAMLAHFARSFLVPRSPRLSRKPAKSPEGIARDAARAILSR